MQDQEENLEPRRALRPPLPQTGEMSSKRPAAQAGSIDEPVSPEMLVPRLGDYLLEMGMVRSDQLQHALDYQRANAIAGNPKMIGQVLVELGFVTQGEIDRVVTEQIFALQSALKNTNDKLELHVQQRTGALEWRLIQIRTAAEVAQRAISATKLEDLLKITVKLIVERFGYYYAAIFLLDDSQKLAVLREATGSIGQELKNRGYRITVGSQSIIGWVTAEKNTRVVSDVASDPLYLQNELLPKTRSEASIPLLIGDDIVGVLDVQSLEPDAFNRDDVAVLQTLANQIASSIKTLRLLELTQINLQEVNLMYEASSRITKANSTAEIFRITSSTLQQTTYLTMVMMAVPEGLRVFSFNDPEDPANNREFANRFFPVSKLTLERSFDIDQRFLTLIEGESHELLNILQDIPRQTGCKEMVLLPVYSSNKLTCLWLLASRSQHIFNKTALQPYVALAEFVSTTLSKIEALDQAQQQLKRLKILNSLGQVIATELEIRSLFQSVHRQVSQLFGETGFYIALYDPDADTISFPYLYEDGELLQLDPIPLGEGLTSIVIRSRESLLLVGETERLAREMGAKLVGKLAKSWLGVPLMIGDQVLGAMTVQDTERDYAFSEEDASLLTTLASQVSVAIRNARLVESIRKRAEQQRILYEITEKIRRSVDMDTILSTTTSELAKALGARRAQIELRIGESRHDIRSGNGKESIE